MSKQSHKLVAFVIGRAEMPVLFCKPGTYAVEGGRQTTAFAQGTVYFRHGAKSEPGTTQDLWRAMDRQLSYIRKAWLKDIRKIVTAPEDSRVVVVKSPSKQVGHHAGRNPVRIVKNTSAAPAYITSVVFP